MQKVRAFLRRKTIWVVQGKLVWWNLILIGITALALRYPGPVVDGAPSDFRLRVWAMVLQGVGAYIVWRDLVGSADDFGATGVFRSTLEWVKSGLGFPTTVQGSASIQLNSAMSAALGQVRPIIDPTADVKHRLHTLEEYVRHLDTAISGHAVAAQKNKDELRHEIATARSELKQLISELDQKLKNSMIGSYPLLLFGAWWVLIGMMLSSLAPDLAKLAAGQYCALWKAL